MANTLHPAAIRLSTDEIDTFLLSHDFSSQNPSIPRTGLDFKLPVIAIATMIFSILWCCYIRQNHDLLTLHRGSGTDNERESLQLRVELRQTWGVVVVVCSVLVVLVYCVNTMLGGDPALGKRTGEVGVLGGIMLVGGWVLWMLLDIDAWDQRELHTWIDETVRRLWRGEVELAEVFGVVQWVFEDMVDMIWEVWVKQYSNGERDVGVDLDEGGGVRI